jgi:hypothetical protein
MDPPVAARAAAAHRIRSPAIFQNFIMVDFLALIFAEMFRLRTVFAPNAFSLAGMIS